MTEPEVWQQLEDAFRNREWTRAAILADALQECGQEQLADTVRWACRNDSQISCWLPVWRPLEDGEGFSFRLQNPDETESAGSHYEGQATLKGAIYAVHRYREWARAYYCF